jgi:hypothetical protein
MEDEDWEDLGEAGGVGSQFVSTISGGGGETGGLVGDYRNVRHIPTDTMRIVQRGYGQTTGEAIANGQFVDDDD